MSRPPKLPPGLPPGAPPEIQVLVAACRPRLSADTAATIAALVGHGLDWTRLTTLALAHRVTPLLRRAVDRTDLGRFPADLAEALRLHDDRARSRMAELVAELDALTHSLEAQAIPALPFKGPALGRVAYGTTTLRAPGDLDLLVREADVDRVCDTLRARGYREQAEVQTGRRLSAVQDAWYRRYQCEYLFVSSSKGVCVEPHWAIAPRQMAVPLDYDGLWRRARRPSNNARGPLELALEDLFVVLCIHAAKHEWARLQWIADLGWLVDAQPALDWPLALERARRQGCARIVRVGIGLAHRLIGTRLPTPVSTEIAQDGAATALTTEIIAALCRTAASGAPPVPSSVYRLSLRRIRMRERIRDRVAHVARTIFTPTLDHVRLLTLPGVLGLLYYPIKLGADYLARPLWKGLAPVLNRM